MLKRLGNYSFVIIVLVGMASLPAKADQFLDFSCGSGSCTGSVVPGTGSNYSSTGIGVSSNLEGDPFSLAFDTSTGSIFLYENEGSGFFQDFVGTITGFTSKTGGGLTQLNLAVNWTTIPSDVTGGNSGSTPFSDVISITGTGNAWSVDVPISITSVPEPSALVLLAAGLVGLALRMKFKGALVA